MSHDKIATRLVCILVKLNNGESFTVEELAEEYAGKNDIYKVDTEKEEGLAASFGIRSIPSLLFCPMNGQPQMSKGAMGKADFKKAINEVLLKKE